VWKKQGNAKGLNGRYSWLRLKMGILGNKVLALGEAEDCMPHIFRQIRPNFELKISGGLVFF